MVEFLACFTITVSVIFVMAYLRRRAILADPVARNRWRPGLTSAVTSLLVALLVYLCVAGNIFIASLIFAMLYIVLRLSGAIEYLGYLLVAPRTGVLSSGRSMKGDGCCIKENQLIYSRNGNIIAFTPDRYTYTELLGPYSIAWDKPKTETPGTPEA